MIVKRMILLILSLLAVVTFYLYDDDVTVKDMFKATYNEKVSNYAAVRDGYLVWSETCRIPDVSANNPTIKDFSYKIHVKSCGKPITKISRSSEGFHVLSVDVSDRAAKCYYQIITRPHFEKQTASNDDMKFNIGQKIYFTKSTVLPEETEFVFVECGHSNGKEWKSIQKDTHAMVAPKKKSILRVPHEGPDIRNNEVNDFKPSVLMIGLDSISRLNLIRTMPNTYKFLQDEGFSELQGYNKIEDNTLPNLMAILTGMSLPDVRSKCVKSPNLPFDECPFIWKEYKSAGYANAFVEDMTNISTFNFERYGFINAPTDYYFHPFMVASEKLLPITYRQGILQCVGPTHVSARLFNYCLQFAKQFHGQRAFGIFWSNSFSHNELNLPTTKDTETRNFLESLTRVVDNSTVIILLSDHGMRWGPIRETFVGWLEERLPFIFVKYPTKFRITYPSAYQAFLNNRNRLTSPYDLHLTLRDLLEGVNKEYSLSRVGTASCPNCRSLFHQIPVNRSCSDAGISSHWCTCSAGSEKSVPNADGTAKSVAQFVLNTVNTLLHDATNKTKPGTRCAPLGLHRIMNVRTLTTNALSLLFSQFIIILEVKPSHAIFEASVEKRRNSFSLSGTVSRINAYASQSYCMNDAFLKKYCFCIDGNKFKKKPK